MAEEKKKAGCLQWGAAAVGGVFLLGVLGLITAGDDAATGDAGGADQTGKQPIAVTASELHQAFAQNEVAAKARFEGSALMVSGRIDAIELDMLDNPQLRLSAGTQFDYVAAGFDKSASSAVSGLQKGQDVTVLCEEVSEVIGTPMLRNCKLQ